MNKFLATTLVLVLGTANAFALDAVFDSMDKAQEVKLAPAIKTNTNKSDWCVTFDVFRDKID